MEHKNSEVYCGRKFDRVGAQTSLDVREGVGKRNHVRIAKHVSCDNMTIHLERSPINDPRARVAVENYQDSSLVDLSIDISPQRIEAYFGYHLKLTSTRRQKSYQAQ